MELKTKKISEPALLQVYWVKQFRVHCVKREKRLELHKLWVANLMSKEVKGGRMVKEWDFEAGKKLRNSKKVK